MAQFIENPRRAPRAPARCRTAVAAPSGAFESETEDIGTRGCQLVAPRQVRRGEVIELTVTNDKVAEPLRIGGRVAWVSAQAPWRVGIAFDEGRARDSTRWFEKLIAAYPGMSGFQRVPERIAVDATVYLGPPPRFLLDFTADEAMLLRAIASGARVDELQARLRDRWPAAQIALFSLIARQAVTLVRGQAVHPEAWKQVLSDVEASLAVESLGRASSLTAPPPSARPSATPVPGRPSATPVPGRAPAVAARTGGPAVPHGTIPPRDPSPVIDLPDEGGPPLEVATPRRSDRAAMRALDNVGWSSAPPPKRDFKGAGVGWRGGGRARSAEAQAAFDRAKAESAAGNVNAALAELRRALELAPGDPEIGEALGKLAFKGR